MRNLFSIPNVFSGKTVYIRGNFIDVDENGIWLKGQNNGVLWSRVKKIKTKTSYLLESVMLLSSFYLIYQLPKNLFGYLFFLFTLYLIYITKHSAIVYLRDGSKIVIIFNDVKGIKNLFSTFEDFQRKKEEILLRQNSPHSQEEQKDDQKKI